MKKIEKVEEYKAIPIEVGIYKAQDMIMQEVTKKLNELIDVVNTLIDNRKE